MTITLYAQPYDHAATGFYFEDYETFSHNSRLLVNEHGQCVEEFEVQFIDGEKLDAELFKALGVNQANVKGFLEIAPEWEEWGKINIIIACGECGCNFGIESDHPEHFGITIYNVDNLRVRIKIRSLVLQVFLTFF